MASLALPPVGSQISRPAPWARNVVLVTASGFAAEQWAAARESSPAGLLTLDQLPWTGYALEEATSLGDALATGAAARQSQPDVSPRLFAEMRKTGRTVALVAGGSVHRSVGASLCLNSEGLDGAQAAAEIARRVDVLFSRSALPGQSLAEAGYEVHNNAADLILHESVPVAGAIPASELSFDALAFHALHLAARNVKGFALAVDADPETVTAPEFCGALSSILAYARREGRTLVIVLLSRPGGPASTYAIGPGAERFAGTLRLSDVPKLIAGLAHVPFRRDFSATYLARRGMLSR